MRALTDARLCDFFFASIFVWFYELCAWSRLF